MPGIIQEGISKLFKNATNDGVRTGIEYVKTQTTQTAPTNVLQVLIGNTLAMKNAYKAGGRLGLMFLHLKDGKSIYYPPFVCNAASVSCSFAAMGCRVTNNYRPIPGLSLLADGLSICGDVIGKGGERPTVTEMLL